MDRITRIHIKNVRAIESAVVDISPLTVLIGENGSGKSTIIECLEILRKAAGPSFMRTFYEAHRGMPGLLRKGAAVLELRVIVEDDEAKEPQLEYRLSLASEGVGAVVDSERLVVIPVDGSAEPWTALRRSRTKAEVFERTRNEWDSISWISDELCLERVRSTRTADPWEKAVARMWRVLSGIEVHLGFDTLAAWAAQSVQRAPTVRGSATLQPTERLSLLGRNLPNAWFALKNFGEAHWRQTMDLVRLGLGDEVDSVNVVADTGGQVGIALKRVDLPEPIPAAFLSDGQLSWLAYVAMARLNASRSLLAIDEPELHLHPALLGRVVSLLTSPENSAPVVLSTHSDRLLSFLDDPASAVRVCSLEGGKAVVRNVDAEELPKWLEEYGDFGKLRESGFLDRVLEEAPAGEGE